MLKMSLNFLSIWKYNWCLNSRIWPGGPCGSGGFYHNDFPGLVRSTLATANCDQLCNSVKESTSYWFLTKENQNG